MSTPRTIPASDAPLEHAPGRGPGAVLVVRRRGSVPTRAWPAIAIASSARARNVQIWNAIWCAATATSEMRAATAVVRRSASEQRAGADDEVAADDRGRPARRAARGLIAGAGAPGGAPDDHEERDRGGDLGDDGAPRRAGDAAVEPVDEEQLEREVERVRGDRDHERGLGVLHPAQVAGAGERDRA